MVSPITRGPLGSWMLAAALVFSITASAAPESGTDLLTVRGKGHAAGTGALARREAVADALRKVMHEVLVRKAHTDDLTLLRPILRFADRYAARYEVLRTEELGEETEVEVDFHLRDRDIDRDMARIMLPRLPAPPRVLLLIGEQHGPDRDLVVPDFGTAETTLRQGLEGLDLKVEGVDSLRGLYTHPQLVAVVTGGPPAGGAFARERQADVVVVGEAGVSLEGTAGSGEVKRSVCRIHLRVYRVADGDMTYDLNSEAAIYSEDLDAAADQVLEDGAQKLVGDTAMAAVLAVLGQIGGATDGVTLVLEEPRTEARVATLVEALRGDPEIAGAETLFYSEDVARVRLGYRGPMSALAHLLDGAEVAGRALRVRTVIGREITARFE